MSGGSDGSTVTAADYVGVCAHVGLSLELWQRRVLRAHLARSTPLPATPTEENEE